MTCTGCRLARSPTCTEPQAVHASPSRSACAPTFTLLVCAQVTRGDMAPRALWRWAALQAADKAAAAAEPARRGPSAGTLEVRPPPRQALADCLRLVPGV